jgi:hypothetical protein
MEYQSSEARFTNSEVRYTNNEGPCSTIELLRIYESELDRMNTIRTRLIKLVSVLETGAEIPCDVEEALRESSAMGLNECLDNLNCRHAEALGSMEYQISELERMLLGLEKPPEKY